MDLRGMGREDLAEFIWPRMGFKAGGNNPNPKGTKEEGFLDKPSHYRCLRSYFSPRSYLLGPDVIGSRSQ
jgi:hypothetical protein